ncbi:hypothetical protein AAC387_Pa06g3217 [Persea americana]
MKAVVITSPGGPEVLQVQEVGNPRVGDDEVLIRIGATALNRADTVERKGSYPAPEGASPYLGLECAGTVESVGKNVTRWTVGDENQQLSAFLWSIRSKRATRDFLRQFSKIYAGPEEHTYKLSVFKANLQCEPYSL